MINTPKIEAAIAGTSPSSMKLEKHFVEAKAALEQAVVDKKIYNVVFEDHKYWLSRGYETARDVYSGKFRDETRQTSRNWPTGDPRYELGYGFQLNQANAEIKKLRKAVKSPALEEHVEFLKEGAAIWNLIQSVKPFIIKGRVPNPNPKPVDLSGTGDCAICGRVTKMNAQQKIVDHGFQISTGMGNYMGYRLGHCYGVGYLPYELSCEANKDFLKSLENWKKDVIAAADKLRNNPPAQLSTEVLIREGFGKSHKENRTYEKGTEEYEQLREREISQLESRLRMIESDIKMQIERIRDWKLQPLKYGDRPARFNAKLLNQ